MAVESHVSSSIVQSWAKEFSLADIADSETLKSIKSRCEIPFKQYPIASCGMVPVDMEMETLPEEYAMNEPSIEEEMEIEDAQEEDNEEEDEEAMDLDVSSLIKPRTSLPEIVFRPTSKKQRAAEVKDCPALTEQEKLINPQHNQNKKKVSVLLIFRP